MTKKRGLGKGLGALMGDSVSKKPENKGVAVLPVEYLQSGKYQPRKEIGSDKLQELADSIKAQGIVQPILVRELGYNRYEIIAGERRWRAAQLVGLVDVPVIVKEIDDRAAIAIALIENIQREDLNPMEEAGALKRLISEFELTHQQVAEAVGRSRTAVTNLLRLNDLSEEVKELLVKRLLDMGHARALLVLDKVQQRMAADEVVKNALSVRETEKLVKSLQGESADKSPKSVGEKVYDRDALRLQSEMTEFLGAKTIIKHKKNGQGNVVINYSNLDELEGIVAKFGIKS
ncbi:MAG: ParB/RepB/Spo0J family partition protein [Methyloprofundus sp.]|nr:ParB/RepB/Spo0J family partition protein [Methyloprofundus sp.]